MNARAQEPEICSASRLINAEGTAWLHQPCCDEAFAVVQERWSVLYPDYQKASSESAVLQTVAGWTLLSDVEACSPSCSPGMMSWVFKTLKRAEET